MSTSTQPTPIRYNFHLYLMYSHYGFNLIYGEKLRERWSFFIAKAVQFDWYKFFWHIRFINKFLQTSCVHTASSPSVFPPILCCLINYVPLYWNAEGQTGTFILTCTLYTPVIITNQHCFTNVYCSLTSTEPCQVFPYWPGFPCIYVRILECMSRSYRSQFFFSWRKNEIFLFSNFKI